MTQPAGNGEELHPLVHVSGVSSTVPTGANEPSAPSVSNNHSSSFSSAQTQPQSNSSSKKAAVASNSGVPRVNVNGPLLYVEQPNATPHQMQVQPRPLSPDTANVIDNEADTARLRKADRRRQRQLDAEAQHLKQLEDDARKLYIYGFFALPFLWLVSIIYFWDEQKDENASPVIKTCTSSAS